jgi:uncharacterized protein
MEIEFDADKDVANLAKHGISLARAADFVPLSVMLDERYDYSERRYRSWGLIDDETYFLAFTMRDERVRAISLRRVHRKEWNRYAS